MKKQIDSTKENWEHIIQQRVIEAIEETKIEVKETYEVDKQKIAKELKKETKKEKEESKILWIVKMEKKVYDMLQDKQQIENLKGG